MYSGSRERGETTSLFIYVEFAARTQPAEQPSLCSGFEAPLWCGEVIGQAQVTCAKYCAFLLLVFVWHGPHSTPIGWKRIDRPGGSPYGTHRFSAPRSLILSSLFLQQPRQATAYRPPAVQSDKIEPATKKSSARAIPTYAGEGAVALPTSLAHKAAATFSFGAPDEDSESEEEPEAVVYVHRLRLLHRF